MENRISRCDACGYYACEVTGDVICAQRQTLPRPENGYPERTAEYIDAVFEALDLDIPDAWVPRLRAAVADALSPLIDRDAG